MKRVLKNELRQLMQAAPPLPDAAKKAQPELCSVPTVPLYSYISLFSLSKNFLLRKQILKEIYNGLEKALNGI